MTSGDIAAIVSGLLGAFGAIIGAILLIRDSQTRRERDNEQAETEARRKKEESQSETWRRKIEDRLIDHHNRDSRMDREIHDNTVEIDRLKGDHETLSKEVALMRKDLEELKLQMVRDTATVTTKLDNLLFHLTQRPGA